MLVIHAVSISICQEVLSDSDIEVDLTYIASSFVLLKFAIIKLEEKGIPLTESVKVIEDMGDNLPFGKNWPKIKEKLDLVLKIRTRALRKSLQFQKLYQDQGLYQETKFRKAFLLSKLHVVNL